MLYLAFGSALYHSSATWIRKYNDLDVSAMYAVFAGLVWYSDAVLLGFSPVNTAIGMFIVAAVAAYWLRYRYPGNLNERMGIALLLTLVFALIIHFAVWPFLAVVVVLFAASYVLRYLDEKRNWALGHGLWHLGTAVAIGLLFATITRAG